MIKKKLTYGKLRIRKTFRHAFVLLSFFVASIILIQPPLLQELDNDCKIAQLFTDPDTNSGEEKNESGYELEADEFVQSEEQNCWCIRFLLNRNSPTKIGNKIIYLDNPTPPPEFA